MGYLQSETQLDEPVLLRRLAEALGWPYLESARPPVDVAAEDVGRLALELPAKVAFGHLAVPVVVREGRLVLAVNNPFDSGMLSAVQFSAKRPVQFALVPREQIEDALKERYGMGATALDQMVDESEPDLEITGDKEIAGGDQEASVIKFVNDVIKEAYNGRATDIHFEPMERRLRIRYRIDGMLYEQPLPPQLSDPKKVKHYQAAIISRVKVMSGMNIAEKRLPQDGRINVRISKQELDIRVSTVPTVYGESVSLRLLNRGDTAFNISNLGLSASQQGVIENLIKKPHGIFLVTGPTGSGKSTSLYCFLSFINRETKGTKRILTVEEPVEYEIQGVNQIAVRPEIGLSFAVGLRHILRQDPNVVMVGEIRDLETAEIAIRAALTGHLVFSTLHTNDAASAFTRLIDMGIEPFLVASSVEAVMAQRLVRTVCPDCQTQLAEGKDYSLEYLLRKKFPAEWAGGATFYKGAGCDECRQLGYQGRTGIYELLVMTEKVRPLVMERSPASRIVQQAKADGSLTLREDGWLKTQAERIQVGRDGKPIHPPTTIEEVLRVTQIEEHIDELAGPSHTPPTAAAAPAASSPGHEPDPIALKHGSGLLDES